jgi:hypothetical protein
MKERNGRLAMVMRLLLAGSYVARASPDGIKRLANLVRSDSFPYSDDT